tara:strand:+ start:354 stop:638 length:285 start_codon:yes stop_codon:yes gene_type:complete
MKFDELNKMEDYCLDGEYYEIMANSYGEDEEHVRLMWRLCRDKFDKAMMLSYWFNGIEDDLKVSEYQSTFINKCKEVLLIYQDSAPTWIDIALK